MIVLHHCHQTRSMRTLWLLHELGVDFDVVVHPFGKELRDPAYLAKHPVGRVPSIEIDGAVLFETGAIAEILTEKFPDAGLGRAMSHPERREYLVWLHFAETISTHAQILTQQHIMLYEDHMRSPVVMSLEAKRLAKCYSAVEAQLQDGREFLQTGGFSAADIAIAQSIYMAQHFSPVTEFPSVRAWLDRLFARPSFQKSLPGPGDDLLYRQDFYEVEGG